jgi:hypothetical protein
MNRGQIDSRITKALNHLLENDDYLFDHSLNERAIAHKLAVYLHGVFPSWHVDCEYNREGDVVKKIPLSDACKKLLRRTGAVSPDIIIHKRGPNGPNLLAIEIKKVGQAGKKCDLEKLQGYIQHIGYEYGLFLCFRTGPIAMRIRDRILLPEAPPNN